MAGMGPDESLRMIELIGRVRQRVTVLLIEHDRDAVFRLAERISVLVNGAIIASGILEETFMSGSRACSVSASIPHPDPPRRSGSDP